MITPVRRLLPVFLPVLSFLVLPPMSRAADRLTPEKPIPEAVDHYIRQKLQEAGIEAARPAADSTLIRRLTLDLAGRIPTAAEARAFVRSEDPNKRTRLVERLLASPDFAYHQRNELDLMLLARRKNDREWREYLLKSTRENRPWDRVFREVMLGRKDRKPEEDAALEFLKTRARELDEMTNDTSQVFFGVSINCAKCHDHPLVDDWKQDHYYGLASFFSRTYLDKKKILGEKSKGEVKFKTTSGEEKKAKFMFLTGAVVEETGRETNGKKQKDQKSEETSKFSPRAQLVELALQKENSSFFARSIVNRIWHRLMGRGLVEPLNQMHSGNPASHPELLDWLARDLVSHNFDLKRLIRGLVLSETYARSSRWGGSGDPPYPDYFAIAVPRPLNPRQYALSLLLATANPDKLPAQDDTEAWSKRREQLENSANGWVDRFEIPDDRFQISVDEALLLSNNEQVENDLLRNSGDQLVGFLNEIKDHRKIVEEACWAVLSRSPDEKEMQALTEYLSQREDRREQGIQQIVWALLTGPEMRFNY